MLTRRATFAAAALAISAPAISSRDHIVVANGQLVFGPIHVRCAVGRTGIRADKREGDGATPAGSFTLREILYRPDRAAKPDTSLRVSAIAPADAWSDDPADPAYNRRVTTPHPFHTETLWRHDPLYDVLAVIGANDSPAIPGHGSAIFLHIASRNYGGTDGCVALARPDLLQILARCGPDTEIEIRSRDTAREWR